MAEIDLTQFEGHTPGPWRPKELATYQQPGNVVMWPDKGGAHMRRLDYQGGFTKIDARLIAAAPTLLAEVKRQAEEIERLRGALNTIAMHLDSSWPERCQESVFQARAVLLEQK